MRNVAILGATGSIGASALDVIARHPDRFRVSALAAHRKVDELVALCVRFQPDLAVVADSAFETALRSKLASAGLHTRVASGDEGLREVATSGDTVVAAIVGAAGLDSTLAAARAGKRVLLANKEAVVMAGALLLDALRQGGGELIPIDSEHNAIFQCLPSERPDLSRAGVRRVLLTASGGPFRGRTRAELATITPEQACAHPNWTMGRKISVDSATLMNKGLEVIEAHWLFGAPADLIEVVIHPQSVIHSMVSYVDGSVLAQLGNPDMRTPIAHALAFPERIASGVAQLDLTQWAALEFHKPDFDRFPCLALAFDALRAGGTAPALLNAANEVAVQAFLERRIGFRDIDRVVRRVMDENPHGAACSIEAVMAQDARARDAAERIVHAL